MQLISHSFNLRWQNTKKKVITAYTAAYHRQAFLLVGSHSTHFFFVVFFLLFLPHSVYFFSFSKCVCAATGFDRLTHSPHSPRPHSLVVFFVMCCVALIIIISGLATRVTHLYHRSESFEVLLLADGDIDDGVGRFVQRRN